MTKKVELAFERLLRAYNKKRGGYKRLKSGKLVSTAGWVLDGAYGGYKVAEKRGSSSGHYQLFDDIRRSPAEFVRWVDIVVSAKRQGR
jgi:hypothetical protein